MQVVGYCNPTAARARRGVATVWTGVGMSTPLLPEVVPEMDANPASFYSGGGGLGALPLDPTGDSAPKPRYRLVLRSLAMCVHPTFFDLATPLRLWVHVLHRITAIRCSNDESHVEYDDEPRGLHDRRRRRTSLRRPHAARI